MAVAFAGPTWSLSTEPGDVQDAYFDMLRVAGFLAAVWACGRIMKLFRMPGTIGALFAGVVAGPELTGLVPFATKSCASFGGGMNTSAATGDAQKCSYDLWRLIGNTGITLLIFEFGTQLNLQKVRQVQVRALAVGLASTLGPIFVGLAYAAIAFGDGPSDLSFVRLMEGCAVGIALAPTSPVVLRVLDEDDLLGTLPAQTAATAIFFGLVSCLVLFNVLLNVVNFSATPEARAAPASPARPALIR